MCDVILCSGSDDPVLTATAQLTNLRSIQKMSKSVNNSSASQLQDHGLIKETESEPSSSGYVLVLVIELKFCHSFV